MIVLKPSTFRKIYKFPSITGGRGTRVDQQPGGGTMAGGDGGEDAGGANAGGQVNPPKDPFEPPDPFAPSVGSVSGFTVYGAGYGGDSLL